MKRSKLSESPQQELHQPKNKDPHPQEPLLRKELRIPKTGVSSLTTMFSTKSLTLAKTSFKKPLTRSPPSSSNWSSKLRTLQEKTRRLSLSSTEWSKLEPQETRQEISPGNTPILPLKETHTSFSTTSSPSPRTLFLRICKALESSRSRIDSSLLLMLH